MKNNKDFNNKNKNQKVIKWPKKKKKNKINQKN